MSGAHDVARDAAQRMYEAIRTEVECLSYLSSYKDEIETIAEYLGVKEEQ